jgi:membrane protein DedA with SNARE-associated domain
VTAAETVSPGSTMGMKTTLPSPLLATPLPPYAMDSILRVILLGIHLGYPSDLQKILKLRPMYLLYAIIAMGIRVLYDEGMEEIIHWLVETIGHLGYTGILVLMFLESTFFPVPSEVVIPPAGYLVTKGEMNMWVVILCGIVGSVLGALFNYFLAVFLGRPLIVKYGKYILLPPERVEKTNAFFLSHGEISTFTGRLIPGVRHFISFPAGLAHMNIARFCFYTAFGSALWVSILACIGYVVGNNMDLVMKYSRQALLVVLGCMTIVFIIYIRSYRKKSIIKQLESSRKNE